MPKWWLTAEAHSLTTLTSAERVIALADDLTANFDTLRSDHARVAVPPRHLLRWDYNPLLRHPLVSLPDGRVIAPQPRLLLRRMSPGGLYYTGIDRLGTWFPSDLGKVVEHYVGLNLRSVPGTSVEGEIRYDKDGKLSVDWFWQHGDMLVLVEVKAMRAALGARTGARGFATELTERLDIAVKQLNRSALRIDDRHPSFKHLPASAARVGLIVTAEPIYPGNSTQLRKHLAPSTMPTLIVSLRDIERLVAHDATAIFAALRRIATDPTLSTWLLSSAMVEVLPAEAGPGPLLRQALAEIDIDPPGGVVSPP
jgi:hypothetical protein